MKYKARFLPNSFLRMPRLIVHALQLHNFKSYFGTHDLGPFHSSFSAVIGPNGSGKSNVIDSLLFVFAFQSRKLRMSNLCELIHDSAACNGKKLTEAYVAADFALYDDETGERTHVMRVKRQINATYKMDKAGNEKRVGTSSYSITPAGGRETPTAKSDVVDLLKKYAVDLEKNRFLILQGEVEQISLMKPKRASENAAEGFLEYLEEIIGSDQLVPKINEAEETVKEVGEARDGLMTRLKIAESDRHRLEGARAAAEGVLTTMRDLKAAEVEMYTIQHRRTSDSAKELEEKASAMKEEEETAQKAVDAAHKELAGTRDADTAAKAEQEGLQNAVEEAQKTKTTAEKDHAAAQRAADGLAKDKARLTKALSRGAAEQSRLENEQAAAADQLADTLSHLTEESGRLTQAQADLRAIIMEHKSRTVDPAVAREVAAIERRLGEVMDEMRSKARDKVTYEADLAQETEGSASLQAEAARLEAAVSSLRATINATRERTVAIQAELGEEGPSPDQARHEVNELAARERQLKQQARAASSARESGKRSAKIIAALTKEINASGTAPGQLLARLGDLVACDAKYDIAVSNSGNFDVIIVDTVEMAQWCMGVMKRQRLGVGSFVGLDFANKKYKQQMDRGASDWDTISGAGKTMGCVRAVDVVSVPSDVLDAFAGTDDSVRTRCSRAINSALYMAVRDTAIAPDIDTAGRAAGRGGIGSGLVDKSGRPTPRPWRVVTLDGSLADTSGSLTGGGVASSGAVRINGRAADPVRALRSVQAALDDANRTLRHAEATASRTREVSGRLRIEATRLKDLEAELDGRTAALEAAQVKVRQGTSKKAAALQAQINAVEAALEGLKADASALQADLDGLQTRQLGDEDGRVSHLKDLVGTTERAVVDLRGQKKELEAKAADLKRRAVKADKKMAADQAAVESLGADVKAANERLVAAGTAATEANGVLKAAEQTLADFIERMSDLFERVADAEKALTEAEEVAGAARLEHARAAKLADEAGTRAKNFKALADKCQAAHEDAQAVLGKLGVTNMAGEGDDVAPNDDDDEDDGDVSMGEEVVVDEVRRLKVLRATIESLNTQAADQTVDTAIVEQWVMKNNVYNERAADVDRNTADLAAARTAADTLRKQRLTMFRSGCTEISNHLQTIYRMLTMGGNAELEIVDTLDPFSEGVSLTVMPPRKSWKRIGNLSGGERTLSSLALIFALHCFRPTPIYVMDEIDAALDFKNVSIVAEYVKERTKDAQFLIISLRNNMFELADRLVGIYKINDQTRSLAIDPADVADLAEEEEEE